MTQYKQQGIYLGSRGTDFKDFIVKLLQIGGIKTKYISILTDTNGMKLYTKAFTSESVDSEDNYQVLEQVGDLSGNKIIVNYMYEKFPQLDCTEGVKVVARLRINYGAKQCFSEIARKLGFWNFISASNELRQRKMKSLLEDVFEAFLGATERLGDKIKRVGFGYAIVYDILASIFDEMDISLKYEDLYDAKTRLKELFDTNATLGSLIYEEQKSETFTLSTIFLKNTEGKFKIGEGKASLKADAQQKAASNSLYLLSKKGISKPIPKIYQQFNNCETLDIQDLSINSKWLESTECGNTECSINSLHSTKEKSKYNNNYQSTPLAAYCRKRNLICVKECLKLKADPNIPDTDGMFPLDLLFIGKTDESSVEDIFKCLLNSKHILNIHRPVFNMYVGEYVCEYIVTNKEKLCIIDD